MNRLDFATDPDMNLDPGSIFPLFQHLKTGRFKTKLLKKLWMNAHVFWSVVP